MNKGTVHDKARPMRHELVWRMDTCPKCEQQTAWKRRGPVDWVCLKCGTRRIDE